MNSVIDTLADLASVTTSLILDHARDLAAAGLLAVGLLNAHALLHRALGNQTALIQQADAAQANAR